jgi:hypothetical protein
LPQQLIDINEYTDLDIIKGHDGYVTPNATFIIVRDSNLYSLDLTHDNWSKKYVREKEWYHIFKESVYNKESDFLEKGLKYIRYANMDVITNSLKGNELWELYKDYNNGNYLFTSDGNNVKVGCDLIFNGNAIMNPTLYTNSFNYTNGFNAFSKSVYGNNMMNNTNWDWQGKNLVGAKIYDSYAGYSLIEECFKSNKDIENDINIKIACEDISSVDSDGDVSYKLDDMFKLLYSKIDKLEKEIEVLKKEGA